MKRWRQPGSSAAVLNTSLTEGLQSHLRGGMGESKGGRISQHLASREQDQNLGWEGHYAEKFSHSNICQNLFSGSISNKINAS